MNFKISQKRLSKLSQLILPLIAVIITISIVCFPDDAFKSALEGLNIWFNTVLPALLPFFIGSQLLMGLGVVHFLGVLLEPFMRPLFNVPGAGSFVMAMGLASGYPVGAMLTGKLVKSNLCNKWEAERLISFSNTADPLFMIGAVAVGMFKDARLGTVICLSHYISALMLGFIMKFYAYNKPITHTALSVKKNDNIILRATRELIKARKEDNRPFGELLGDCIRDSVNSMLLILGFIILFSVIIRIITISGFVNLICPVINFVLKILGFDKSLSPAIVSGVFEITLGTQLASQASASLMQKVIIASSIIAWSGLSVHFQVMSMIVGTDIKVGPYIIARALHAVLAGFVAYFLMLIPKNQYHSLSIPVFSSALQHRSNTWLAVFNTSSKLFLMLFLVLVCISIIFHLIKNIKIVGFKVQKK